jgi:hypothetical protein
MHSWGSCRLRRIWQPDAQTTATSRHPGPGGRPPITPVASPGPRPVDRRPDLAQVKEQIPVLKVPSAALEMNNSHENRHAASLPAEIPLAANRQADQRPANILSSQADSGRPGVPCTSTTPANYRSASTSRQVIAFTPASPIEPRPGCRRARVGTCRLHKTPRRRALDNSPYFHYYSGWRKSTLVRIARLARSGGDSQRCN